MRVNRRRFLVGGASVFLAGCSESSAPGDAQPEASPTASESTESATVSSEGDRGTVQERTATETATGGMDRTDSATATAEPTPTASSSGLGTVPTADETLYLSMSPAELREAARSGGPPKDGIPSIDQPSFVDADAADHVADEDVVLGVERNGVAKAYPRMILVQHEIVNDDVDGENVAVTYCPLTGTAQGFKRKQTEFGVSGRLINNNLVMYDRDVETWWPQIPATSIPGPWHEDPPTKSLEEFRVIWTTWANWREYRSDTSVLSEDTGYVRSYDRDPYGDYYSRDSTLFPRLNPDDSYHAKETFMGVRTTEGAALFHKDTLRNAGTMTGEVGGNQITAVYDARLDTAYVYHNPDGESISVDGSDVTIGDDTYDPDAVPLDRLYTFDGMWFAWIGFYPDANVYA